MSAHASIAMEYVNMRKQGLYIAVLLSVGSVFLMGGCTKGASGSAVTEIALWTFPNFTSETGKSGDFERSLIAAFEAQYPSIKVNFTQVSFTDGDSVIEAAIKAGTPPDVVYDAPGRILVWAQRGLLEPLDDILATEKPSITTGLLTVSTGTDRRTYMYPMHQVPFSMAFNKELLEDLDVIDLLPYKRRDRQWTVLEYETLLKALKAKLPAGKVPGVFYYKTQGGDQGTRAFLVNLYGNAGLLNEDYSQYIFNTPEAVKNLAWTARALKQGWLLDGADLTSNDAIALFAGGKAAHTILYSPQLNKMYDGKRNYNGKDFTSIYMPFPNDSQSPLLEFLAGGACLFKSDDSAKLEAAKSLIHFAATDKVWAPRLVAATGGFPASEKVQIAFNDSELLYNSVLQRFFGQYYNNIQGFSTMRGYWNTLLKETMTGKDIQASADSFVRQANTSLNP